MGIDFTAIHSKHPRQSKPRTHACKVGKQTTNYIWEKQTEMVAQTQMYNEGRVLHVSGLILLRKKNADASKATDYATCCLSWTFDSL